MERLLLSAAGKCAGSEGHTDIDTHTHRHSQTHTHRDTDTHTQMCTPHGVFGFSDDQLSQCWGQLRKAGATPS